MINHDVTMGSWPEGEFAEEAVDSKKEKRPGVPMELDPPRPAGNAHWVEPERQPERAGILKRKGLVDMTPVFGTAVPPRGLSGIMRRAAYHIPEHRTSHWLWLLLADRVDAIEHGYARRWLWAVPAVAAGAIALAMYGRRRRSRFGWR
jgi:hypothetical protein